MNALRNIAIIAAACAASAYAPAQAEPHHAKAGGGQCFQSSEFEGWSAPDESTIYVRVRVSDIYRLKLTGACPGLNSSSRLITKFRGSNAICNATDWDLAVSPGGPGSIPVPCIVRSMHKLSPTEIAAIPKRSRP